ncbi:MAG: hypothetical protein IT345_10680 [Trueperaceae bacterium]|nr:hypothetical protein [Trueperaceae bacterium]
MTLLPVPAQYTTDASVIPTKKQRDAIAAISNGVQRYAAIAEAEAYNASQYAEAPVSYEEADLLAEIASRKGLLEAEQARLHSLFRRMDNLYYPETVMDEGGADHWPLAPKDRRAGKVHVSVNTPPVYVDIPASLQAVVPVENYVAMSNKDDDREQAGRAERLYFQWKEDSDFELEIHKGCVVKALYGFTFLKVWWDSLEKRPAVRVLDSPENLYVGWGDSDFRRMDWTIYCYGLSPQAVEQEFGLSVARMKGDDEIGESSFPYVMSYADHADPLSTINSDVFDRPGGRQPTAYEMDQVEVYDYWYKKPRLTKSGRPGKPEIWNAVYVGNRQVKNKKHAEYDELPYIPLPNTYIPGSPYGRAELYDLEQLLREKDERITEAAQMIHGVVQGQMWQLVGDDAPDSVSDNMIPRPNKVATPGAGNELKAIQPYVPQFAIEDYLKRIDGELENGSGLNELLMGRAPATILGSSKAITALVANYEARIRMKRDLLYHARKRAWAMAAKVWEAKDKEVAEIIAGQYRLHVLAPELTPRDELEIAQMAINLAQNRLWSMERAMDRTGVEDPGDEKLLIRNEQTDPALNPAAVQAQATLLSLFQQLGVQPPQGAQEQAANTARNLIRPAAGGQSLNAPENQGNPPVEAQPANAQGGPKALAQTLLQGGEASGRVIGQVPLETG